MTQESTPILEPCPFCGSEVLEFMPMPAPWGIVCRKCGAETCLADTKAEAIAAWNRRTPPTSQSDEALVIQADRDAAAAICSALLGDYAAKMLNPQILGGKYDDYMHVQVFARHRIEAKAKADAERLAGALEEIAHMNRNVPFVGVRAMDMARAALATYREKN